MDVLVNIGLCAAREQETALFKNIAETEFPTANVPGGYPADAMTTNPNQFVAKLNGSDKKVGPSLVLRVMSGDKLEIGVKSFFRSQGSVGSSQNPVPEILSALAAGIVGKAGESKGTLDLLSNDVNSPLLGAVNLFRTNNNSSAPGVPKAYLNWLLLDEQFNFVAASSSARRVSTPDALELLPSGLINIAKNGFLYVYVSNETQNYDVFFNDLSVVHKTGPLLEETHYYPYGLTIAAISSRAFGKLQNNFKFNGGSELNEGLGLHLYETPFRLYDPQLRRFWAIDEKAEKYPAWSPYTFALDNPVLLNDPTGLDPDPEEEERKKNAQTLQAVEVVGRRNWDATINRRLALGFARGIKGPAFFATDSKALIHTVTLRLGYRDQIHAGVRQTGMAILEIGVAFVPAAKVVQGVGLAFKLVKGFQIGSKISALGGKILNSPSIVKYMKPMLTELGGNILKEALVNYDNVFLKSDYYDITAATLLSPFGVKGKVVSGFLEAFTDKTYAGHKGWKGTKDRSIFNGSKRNENVLLDLLGSTIKYTGIKLYGGDFRTDNAIEAVSDNLKSNVGALNEDVWYPNK